MHTHSIAVHIHNTEIVKMIYNYIICKAEHNFICGNIRNTLCMHIYANRRIILLVMLYMQAHLHNPINNIILQI